MKLVKDSSAKAFLEAAGPLLYEEEAEFGLMLGLAEGLADGIKAHIKPLLLRIEENGRTTAAALHARLDAIVLSALNTEQARVLASHLLAVNHAFTGVVGPSESIRNFCRQFPEREAKTKMAQRLLKVEKVIPPRPVSGFARPGTPRDLFTATAFGREFFVEAIPWETPSEEMLADQMKTKLEKGGLFFWEDDGETVACTQISRPTRNGISIGFVYTPKHRRGRGYASNLVAFVSQQMLDAGRKFCVLYTDASNPTSNKIYESIGYRFISTSEHVYLGGGHAQSYRIKKLAICLNPFERKWISC